MVFDRIRKRIESYLAPKQDKETPQKHYTLSEPDKKALKGFIDQIYWGDNLSSEQSIDNIKKGLLEVWVDIFGIDGCSNGLLITDNGYFLAVKHGIYSFPKKARIVNGGKSYDLEKVCAVCNNQDIALAKINLDGEPIPRNYKIYNSNNPKVGTVAMLLSRRFGETKSCYGVLTHPKTTVFLDNGKEKFYNQFSFMMKAYRGDSGGPIVSPTGELMGFAASASKEPGVAGGPKIFSALELIDFYLRNSK